MPVIDTTYRVVTRYETQDQSSTAVGKIGSAADRAARKTSMLKKALIGVGTYLGARAIFGVGKRTLIDFNTQMEQAKMTTAGLLKLNLGGSFNKNMAMAGDLVGRLQMRAKRSIGTTQDMVEMMSSIVRPVSQAGLGMKDLEDLTAGAVVAAKALNKEHVAALDIEQALMGNLSKRDSFARALLEPRGFTTTSFNALSARGRAQELLKAMKDPAIMDLAKAQEKSFAGVTSTLKDNLQIALGKVGLPLMQAMAKEFGNINKWLDANGPKVHQWATDLALSLKKGFEFIRDVFKFIIDHRTVLMSLAKAFLAMKGIGALGRGISAIGVGMTGRSFFGHGMDVFGLKVRRAGKLLGSFSIALGLAYAGLSRLADLLDQSQERGIRARVERSSVDNQIGLALGGKGNFAVQLAKEINAGKFRARGVAEGTPFEGKLGIFGGGLGQSVGIGATLGRAHLQVAEQTNSILRDLTGLISKDGAKNRQMMMDFFTKQLGFAELFGAVAGISKKTLKGFGYGKKAKKTPVNVKIEIPARDPDRFAHQFNDAMEKIAASPTSADIIASGAF